MEPGIHRFHWQTSPFLNNRLAVAGFVGLMGFYDRPSVAVGTLLGLW